MSIPIQPSNKKVIGPITSDSTITDEEKDVTVEPNEEVTEITHQSNVGGETSAAATIARLQFYRTGTESELDEIISKWFDIPYSSANLEKNSAGVKKAEFVLIGNVHTDAQHIINQMAIIDHISKNGDVVLVEGKPAKERVTDHHFGDKVVVLGWDNVELRDKVLEDARRLVAVAQEYSEALERFRTTHKNPKEVIRLNDQFEHEKLSINNTDDIAIRQRNQFLINTIMNIQNSPEYEDKRIFIDAGNDHLKDTNLIEFLERNGKSYIVLIQKKSSVNLCTSLEYLGIGEPPSTQTTATQPTKNAVPKNKVLTIQCADGQTIPLGADWFQNGKVANIGDRVIFKPDMKDSSLEDKFSFDGRTEYKVVNIHEYEIRGTSLELFQYKITSFKQLSNPG